MADKDSQSELDPKIFVIATATTLPRPLPDNSPKLVAGILLGSGSRHSPDGFGELHLLKSDF